jgi:RNA polymerase sigma-70 factor (ECF subfamily)
MAASRIYQGGEEICRLTGGSNTIAMDATDKQLIRRTLAGDGNAFGDLVERYTPAVRAAVLSEIRDPDAVDDLVQDTFCNAYRQLDQLRAGERLAGWLCGIAHNAARRWRWREHKRVDIEDVGGHAAVAAPRFPSPEEELAEAEEQGILWSEIANLDDADRLLILLRYSEDCSYRQIARYLNIPMATVYFRLTRAERALGQQMGRRLVGARPEDVRERVKATRRAVVAALPLVWAARSEAAPASTFWLRMLPGGPVVVVCIGLSAGLHLSGLLWSSDAPTAALPLASKDAADSLSVPVYQAERHQAPRAPRPQRRQEAADVDWPVVTPLESVRVAHSMDEGLQLLQGMARKTLLSGRVSEERELIDVRHLPATTAGLAFVDRQGSRQPATIELQSVRLYGQGSGSPTGNFLADLAVFLRHESGIEARVAAGEVGFLHDDVLTAPIHFLLQGGGEAAANGNTVVDLRPGEAEMLGAYLTRGGLLYFEGEPPYLAAVADILESQAADGWRLLELPVDHPLYSSWFELGAGFPGENKVQRIDLPGDPWHYPARSTVWGDGLGLWGVADEDGRLLAVLSDLPLFRGWESAPVVDEDAEEPIERPTRRPQLMAAANLVALALTQEGGLAARRSLPHWVRAED